MSKRFFLILALVFILLLPCLPAMAEAYNFPSIMAGVQLPDGVYKTVLTQDNLQANEGYIKTRGSTVQAWADDFAARGILLQAFDPANDRVLVISALQDVDAQQLFDINQHTSDVRKKYRLSHGNDGAFTVLGYRYDAVSWKNFTGVGRFLQLRYSYRQGGDLIHRGYQRRTIRNGYTITIDMQVFGRQLKAADNSALNKVFDTFAFSRILPMPELPITLNETETAPVETSKPDFTMKGKTKPNAKLTAVLMSFGTSETKVFNASANKSGNYSLPVQLPGEDVYLMTLTVEYEGLEDFSKSFNIRYQKGLLPAQIIAPPPPELTSDEFRLTGQTTETGVTARLSVNGVESSKNVGKNGSFYFDIDTSKEGAFDIRLTLSKKGLTDRVFSFNSYRYLSRQAQEDAIKQNAVSPEYDELMSNPDAYDAQTLTYEGYITAKENIEGEWTIRFALKKTGSGFEDSFLLSATEDPGLPVNTPVRIYGEMAGIAVIQQESGVEERLPKLQLTLISGE